MLKNLATCWILLTAMLFLLTPASAQGALKISAPSEAYVGDPVEITVTDLFGNPVEDVTVYVNAQEIGKTDSNGKITYTFDSEGIYILTATKLGYLPAASVSISVEAQSTTPEETQTETPVTTPEQEIEVLEGAVIPVSIVSDSVVFQFESATRQKFSVSPTAFFTDGRTNAVLIGDISDSGCYRIEGVVKGEVNVNGKNWKVISVEDYEKLSTQSVSLETLKERASDYVAKEVIVNAYLRETPFEVGYAYVPGVDVYPGSLSDDEETPLLDDVKDLLSDREVEYSDFPTLRISGPVDAYGNNYQAYWKNAYGSVKGLVLPVDFVSGILDEDVLKYLPDERYLLFVENLDIKAEKTTIKEIRENPERYYGKVVELDVTGIGVTKSAKEMLSTVFPAAAASPVDVYLVLYGFFQDVPTKETSIPAFGVSSNPNAISMEDHPDGHYRVKCRVLILKELDDNMPKEPVLIIFEAMRIDRDETPIDETGKNLLLGYVDMLKSYVLGEEHKEGEHEEKPTPTETPESTIVPTPTPTPKSEGGQTNLSSLTVDITPDKITASPGDSINLRLKVDWEPEDWKGQANVIIVLSAAGFEKKYELPGVYLENPPIENEFSYTLPDNLPPLTYKAKIIVEAGGKEAEDSVDITIPAGKTPGFEVLTAIAAVGAACLRRFRS
ncbi:carboxypeptidase-like regulatory domain-containing protein [Archaeoglobus veneficus]|uniref:Carboxypeptidase regulatory-like domain-containing protein n=1 Tax=Archaeoglobus veneficus (strain DSM 11195 / SNP6) TaxID=693661 RepID=F2KS13_ARCVS|nr:carboxypeptidase-like regulatory domain-containing protein [Archaeoglobus veneficus]AEA46854.1 hypothetical protein Arcve_0839 [Archaeoglobus veneficus SNP6]